MQKITPFLWFDNNAEEAMEFYTSIFKNAKISNVMRYGDAGPGPKGSVMSGVFELEGQAFMALNGGEQQNCGWLKDKFGVSWQIVPTVLGELLGDPNAAKSQAAMQAMLGMHKIDIAALQQAYDQA